MFLESGMEGMKPVNFALGITGKMHTELLVGIQ
jgi:hypothetical protein